MSEHRIYRFPEWMETPYKHVILKGNRGTFEGERAEATEHEYRLSESLSRTRRLIREYILCNHFTLFCTFTFDKSKVHDREDYKALKKDFSKFLNNYKNRHDKDFKYLYIPELHKNEAVHFHGVMTTPKFLCSPLKIPKRIDSVVKMVPNTPRYMNWPPFSERFGFFSCSWIKDYTKCATYVSKYMTKELANWFLRHDQMVMHSKGLNRPELMYIGEGYSLPGIPSTTDYDKDFCAVGMRDIYDTAPYVVCADDRWEADYRDDNIVTIDKIASTDAYWDVPDSPDLPWFPWFMPGPKDNFEQVTMYNNCLMR